MSLLRWTQSSAPLAFATALLFNVAPVTGQEIPQGIGLRPGYELTVAVNAIKAPRFLEFGPDDTLFVSVPAEGRIYLCRDENKDGTYEKVIPFVQGKDPKQIVQGMQFHDGWLYFAQLNSISRARDTNGDGKADEEAQVIGPNDLPTGAPGGHMWRALMIYKGRIYTMVGDQTNATDEPISASERKKIWSFALDGSDKKLFATGVRNTEKFAIRPGTDEIWGVDHDLDTMGAKFETDPKYGQPITDHNPPSELNHYIQGGFYGHPWIVGKNQPNLMFLSNPDLLKYARMTIIPEWTMAAHSSGTGMIFYTGDKIPNGYGDAFVAERGSWNATQKVGYCLSRILFENGHPYGEQIMVNFLKNGTEVLGRPADCAQAPDGSILISDDTGNKVYRLRYAAN
jgi:glucose/arabinose dehydrogenase